MSYIAILLCHKNEPELANNIINVFEGTKEQGNKELLKYKDTRNISHRYVELKNYEAKQYLKSKYQNSYCLSDFNHFNKKSKIEKPEKQTFHTRRLFIFDVFENLENVDAEDIITALVFLSEIKHDTGKNGKRFPLKVSKRYEDMFTILEIQEALIEYLLEVTS